MFPTAPRRLVLGFLAGALSVLTFHAAMWELLHLLDLPGLGMPPPYPMGTTAPLGVPVIASLCFWGGLYGILLGVASPGIRMKLPFAGLLLGLLAVLVAATMVAFLRGNVPWFGWQANDWALQLLINGFWGIGVGVIYGLLAPRPGAVPA